MKGKIFFIKRVFFNMKTKVKYILYDQLIDRKYAEEKDHYKYKIAVASARSAIVRTGFSNSRLRINDRNA